MQYNEISNKKLHFIVTPDELRAILKDFHHVVVSSGVSRSYVESDPNDFFLSYEALYQKLKNGEKLVWKENYDIVGISTGITGHLENCIYKPTSMLSVPDFSEPCPYIDTFCFFPYKEQLSTSFYVAQFPENVCGLCLCFPIRTEYDIPTQKHSVGVVNYNELDDYETYEILISRIKSITTPLKLDFNGKVRLTSVRISNEAKKDVENFYFITSNNITVT